MQNVRVLPPLRRTTCSQQSTCIYVFPASLPREIGWFSANGCACLWRSMRTDQHNACLMLVIRAAATTDNGFRRVGSRLCCAYWWSRVVFRVCRAMPKQSSARTNYATSHVFAIARYVACSNTRVSGLVKTAINMTTYIERTRRHNDFSTQCV